MTLTDTFRPILVEFVAGCATSAQVLAKGRLSLALAARSARLSRTRIIGLLTVVS